MEVRKKSITWRDANSSHSHKKKDVYQQHLEYIYLGANVGRKSTFYELIYIVKV